MAYVNDAHFIPAHFVGHGQFQHLERAHWADSAGNWLPGPPGAENQGFVQVHPQASQSGFTQLPAAPARRVVLQGLHGNPPMSHGNPIRLQGQQPAFLHGGGPSIPQLQFADPQQQLREAVLASLLSRPARY